MPFYLNLPARDIYGWELEENILLQGIIDLYFVNKNGETILVDYKTDYTQNVEILVTKYKKQLELYKIALEKSLQKKVAKTYIYSLYLNTEIEI